MKYFDCHTAKGMLEYRDKNINHDNTIFVVNNRFTKDQDIHDKYVSKNFFTKNELCLFCENCFNIYHVVCNMKIFFDISIDEIIDKSDNFNAGLIGLNRAKRNIHPEINYFDSISYKSGERECPFCHVKYSIVELDPDIAVAISILNRKGYKTNFCCQGHSIGNNAYIAFENDSNIVNYLHLLPDTWYFDLEDVKWSMIENNIVIRSDYIDEYNHAEAMDDIARFAEMLPENN